MPFCHIYSLPGLTSYADALTRQQELARQRQQGEGQDSLLLLEHPPTITLGRGARWEDMRTNPQALAARGITVVESDRGGEITYHAPGQIVGYPIFDLNAYGKDLHAYLRNLEEVLIVALESFGIDGTRIPGLTGVWVGEEKIAAMGIKVSRWVTMHGFALNTDLDLTPMRRDFVPCGIRDKGVTSLAEQQPERAWRRQEVEDALVDAFTRVFGMHPIRAGAGILIQ